MIELLSPAGDFERLKIAFLYGADAVYAGGQNYSLRANAHNFSIEDIGHTKIPGDTYFVMGDNRSNSLDSRYPSVGVIKKNQIVGRTRFIIWPINRFGKIK